jgi:hypothetical protein
LRYSHIGIVVGTGERLLGIGTWVADVDGGMINWLLGLLGLRYVAPTNRLLWPSSLIHFDEKLLAGRIRKRGTEHAGFSLEAQ